MERIRRAERLLVRAQRGLLVAILAVMVVLSFSQVVMRQFFRTGLLWGDTLLRHLVLWVGFLGAGLAAAESKHFAFEAGSHLEGPRGRWLKLAGQAAALIVTALLVHASWRFLLDERAMGSELFRTAGISVPGWIFAAVIPAGFLLVFLHTAVRAAETVLSLRGKR